jgi:medium-chain acyl-[acyl-carrier-protein] hydrolase
MNMLDDRIESQTDRPKAWFHTLARAQTGQGSIVAFPAGGGNATNFVPWAQQAEGIYGLIGVSLPGRLRLFGLEPISDPDRLVAGYMTAQAALDPPPMVLFGHSCGAYFAYACADALERSGAPGPRAVVVAAAAPPGAKSFGTLSMSDADLFDYVTGTLKDEVNEIATTCELRDQFLSVLRADLTLARNAETIRRPLHVPLVALAGQDDPIASPEMMDGWAHFTLSDFDRYTMKGGHFFPRDARDDFLAVIGTVVGRYSNA